MVTGRPGALGRAHPGCRAVLRGRCGPERGRALTQRRSCARRTEVREQGPLHSGGDGDRRTACRGTARTSDGVLMCSLRPPKETGGDGSGTNPEQLFAIGYAACFEGALGVCRAPRADGRPATPRSTVASAWSRPRTAVHGGGGARRDPAPGGRIPSRRRGSSRRPIRSGPYSNADPREHRRQAHRQRPARWRRSALRLPAAHHPLPGLQLGRRWRAPRATPAQALVGGGVGRAS